MFILYYKTVIFVICLENIIEERLMLYLHIQETNIKYFLKKLTYNN